MNFTQWFTEHAVEIIGACFALLYLWLEIKQRKAMWIVGIISSMFYVYIFYVGKIYADMGMNVYYILASIYGLVLWQRNAKQSENKKSITVSRTTLKTALRLTAVTIFFFAILAFILVRFTDSPVPYIDALTTALSITAMWMLAHKLIEQWHVWFVVNIISMALYFYRGLYPTSILFLIYSIASVIGYYQWKKELKKS